MVNGEWLMVNGELVRSEIDQVCHLVVIDHVDVELSEHRLNVDNLN